jgi:hypothetical protein
VLFRALKRDSSQEFKMLKQKKMVFPVLLAASLIAIDDLEISEISPIA